MGTKRNQIDTVAFWSRDDEGVYYTTETQLIDPVEVEGGGFTLHVHLTVPVKKWKGKKPVVGTSCIGDVVYTPL